MHFYHLYDSKTRGAIALTFYHANFLWWWTWLQFLVSLIFGLPYLHSSSYSLSGYYVPAGSIPFNLADVFLGMTILAVILVGVGASIYLKSSQIKIRPVFLLTVFSALAIGFSWMVVAGEDYHYEVAIGHTAGEYPFHRDPEKLEKWREIVTKYETYRGLPLSYEK